MPTFTLRSFEQVGTQRSEALRFLGQRQTTAATVSEAKQWLSRLIAEGRLEPNRFYKFDSFDCAQELARDLALNIAFYLFPDGRLCPLRIWSGTAQGGEQGPEPEWAADFTGIPGWSLIASIEPRWRCRRTIPAERSWIGRSRRDWEKRDCYVLGGSFGTATDCAA